MGEIDPVPYLDILGVAEGAILLICASLPTLGPLVRRAKDKYGRGTDGSSGPSNLRTPGVGPSHTGSGNQNWDSFKGMRLEHPEDGLSSAGGERSMHSESVDDIPLVASDKRGR